MLLLFSFTFAFSDFDLSKFDNMLKTGLFRIGAPLVLTYCFTMRLMYHEEPCK